MDRPRTAITLQHREYRCLLIVSRRKDPTLEHESFFLFSSSNVQSNRR